MIPTRQMNTGFLSAVDGFKEGQERAARFNVPNLQEIGRPKVPVLTPVR